MLWYKLLGVNTAYTASMRREVILMVTPHARVYDCGYNDIPGAEAGLEVLPSLIISQIVEVDTIEENYAASAIVGVLQKSSSVWYLYPHRSTV